MRVLEGVGRTIALLATAAALTPTSTTAQDGPDGPTKAAVVYNVTRFVEWPVPGKGAGTFVIGVLGEDGLGRNLDRLVAGRTAAGQPIVVVRLAAADQLVPCSVLFVGSGAEQQLDGLRQRLRGSATLLIGDGHGFARKGGMVGVSTERDRLRLEVNVAAAEAAGLRVSSRLLHLARLVAPHEVER